VRKWPRTQSVDKDDRGRKDLADVPVNREGQDRRAIQEEQALKVRAASLDRRARKANAASPVRRANPACAAKLVYAASLVRPANCRRSSR